MSRPRPSGRDGELWSRYVLTNVLLLLLVLPSTVAGSSGTNHQSHPLQESLYWLATNTTVEEVSQKDVQLVWKYYSREPVEEIMIIRSDVTDQQGEDVASWTLNGGSKTNRDLSTDVNLQHRTEGDVGILILTLIKAYPVDFDKQYQCQVSTKTRSYSNRKQLKSIKLEYRPVTEVVEARPGEDVKFVWIYKYPLPVGDVLFYRDEDIMKTDILYWKQNFGEYGDVVEEYENRAKLNMISNNDQVEITLTLLDTRVDDYNHSYYSWAITPNGHNKVSGIYLRPLPELEYQPVTKVVEGRPGEDVKLVWIYKYPRPVKSLIFHTDTHLSKDMMTWTNKFGEKVEVEYKNRLRLNMTSNMDQVEITLTLLDTTVEDYNHTYYSHVVAEGGDDVLAHLFLSG